MQHAAEISQAGGWSSRSPNSGRVAPARDAAGSDRPAQWLKDTNGGDGISKPYGWYLCATVIDPDPPATASLAQRCEQVLPAGVSLESRPGLVVDSDGALVMPEPQTGLTCQQWAESLYAPLEACRASGELAVQWMQHYYSAPTHTGFSIGC